MQTKKQEANCKGLKLNRFSIYTMVSASALIIVTLVITVFMSRIHKAVNSSTDDYIVLSKQAEIVEDASDYLTEQVRLFVMTEDLYYAKQYFKEANDTRRRENALAVLQSHHLAAEWSGRMEKAVETSNALMEHEIYAMKLIAVANDYSTDLLPEEIQAIELEEADASLTSAEMTEKARGMMYNEEYQYTKAVIYEHLAFFTQGILLATEKNMTSGLNNLSHIILCQRLLLLMMASIIVLTFVVIRRCIVIPLHVQLMAIEEHTAEEVRGAYELQCLLNAYNEELNSVQTVKQTSAGQNLSDTSDCMEEETDEQA